MLQTLRSSTICWVIGTVISSACERVPPPVAPEPPRTVAPVAPLLAQEPQPTSEKVAWLSQAESHWTSTVKSKPVTMAPGQRCVTFRTLPLLEFPRNTLIEDACLEIPSNTSIVVQGGVTLGIVATNGLRLGKNVTFGANGAQGRQGDRADFESITYTPNSDVEISAVCVDNGNRCTCPSGDANAAAIRGHTGGAGVPGGFVRLVSANLVSGTQLKGFAIDVTGGIGGPPGESGRRNCQRGTIRCASIGCSVGASKGAQGADGRVTIALGGALPTLLFRSLIGSTTPTNALTVVQLPSRTALETEVEKLNEEAFNAAWDRRAGQDGY